MFNNSVVCGRIVNDLTLKESVNNNKYCNFTIATTSFYSQTKTTSFIPCIAWNKTAENMVRFLKKGSMVLAQGTLRSRSIENENSTRVNYLTLRADNVVFLDSKRSTTTASAYDPVPQASKPTPSSKPTVEPAPTQPSPTNPEPQTPDPANQPDDSPTKQDHTPPSDEGIDWE